jgi:hypothetical protein
MKKLAFLFAALVFSVAATANQPAPAQSDEAKAKAAELAKLRTAHNAKVDAYKVCLAMERAAANHRKSVPNPKPPTPTAACADPGPFVAPVALAAAPAKR